MRCSTRHRTGNTDIFDKAIANFAADYADQTERDHQALADAVAAGPITDERGV